MRRSKNCLLISERTGKAFDGLSHSIGFAPREAIEGDFDRWFSRESFRIAHDISSYSYPALAKAARPLLLRGTNPALLALTYLGAERTMPNYNTMGLAKASLEAATRYLAFCLARRAFEPTRYPPDRSRPSQRPESAISANCLPTMRTHAPLRRNVTIEEVGNAVAFLLSDLASGITGEIMYVDGGLNTTALGNTEPLPQ